jgi:hypothetical protein
MDAIIIAQLAQCNPDYKIYHEISVHTGRYRHQSFWNNGIFFSPAEVTGFLKDQVHIKGIVLYF